jgi:hypothetical protein
MIQAFAFVNGVFQAPWTRERAGQFVEKMLCPTKHFSGFNVFTREEKIT